jgi:hypothetical protein
VLVVLMQISPPRLHVPSRLTISLSSVDETVYRSLHILPRSLFGLALPDLGAWLGVSNSTHTATSNYHIQDGIATKEHSSFITFI